MNIKSIEQVEIEGRLLFIRTDYDYGLNANSEKINFKIDYSLPTVKYAVENGARVVIASSRRVKEHKHNPEYSLRLAGDMLSRELNTNIYFPEDCIGDAVKKIKQDMNPGDVMLLENLMFYKHETDNNPRFCKKLAESIDVYVSEAFGLLDKRLSSNLGLVEHIKERCAGFSFIRELELLEGLKKSVERPFVVYFSGGDIYSKIELLEHIIERIDTVIFDGLFANTLLKSAGFEIAVNDFDKTSVYRIKKLYDSLIARGKKIVVPEDFFVSKTTAGAESYYVSDRGRLREKFRITGTGEITNSLFTNIIANAQIILWDGYMGYGGMKSFSADSHPLYDSLLNTGGEVVVLTDYDNFINNLIQDYDKFKISYNIDCAYAYLKGELLPALEVLRS